MAVAIDDRLYEALECLFYGGGGCGYLMKVTVIIPARMAATRFPGKPLAKIGQKPIIQWVFERCKMAGVDRVIVATDSSDIADAVTAFGGEYHMTRADHPNGTSRIAEVAEVIDADIIINVQGDEPAIHPNVIHAVVTPFKTQKHLEMATMANPIKNHQDLFNPHIVKVVMNRYHHALYFSRAPIPYFKHQGMHSPRFPHAPEATYYKHIGVYAFRKSFLLRFAAEPPCALESLEGLEQLRALDMGATIHVGITDHTSIGVDEPEDLAKARDYLAREGSIS